MAFGFLVLSDTSLLTMRSLMSGLVQIFDRSFIFCCPVLGLYSLIFSGLAIFCHLYCFSSFFGIIFLLLMFPFSAL